MSQDHKFNHSTLAEFIGVINGLQLASGTLEDYKAKMQAEVSSPAQASLLNQIITQCQGEILNFVSEFEKEKLYMQSTNNAGGPYNDGMKAHEKPRCGIDAPCNHHPSGLGCTIKVHTINISEMPSQRHELKAEEMPGTDHGANRITSATDKNGIWVNRQQFEDGRKAEQALADAVEDLQQILAFMKEGGGGYHRRVELYTEGAIARARRTYHV